MIGAHPGPWPTRITRRASDSLQNFPQPPLRNIACGRLTGHNCPRGTQVRPQRNHRHLSSELLRQTDVEHCCSVQKYTFCFGYGFSNRLTSRMANPSDFAHVMNSFEQSTLSGQIGMSAFVTKSRSMTHQVRMLFTKITVHGGVEFKSEIATKKGVSAAAVRRFGYIPTTHVRKLQAYHSP